MPPVAKTDRETFRKDVDFVAKDDTEQVATGIVMVPHKVDLQGDWERPETIERFAEQFENFEDVGEASGGVMHAVWPDDHISLERNEVVDGGDTINGADVPDGAWVQSWRFDDPDLWALVDDGVLEGYSIGAVDVSWAGPMEQGDLPDEVDVADGIDEDELVWELTDGIVREVSAVDIPAVPDAEILETKAEAEKRLASHLGNRDGFIEEAMERGHSEGDAERLWEYLHGAIDMEGASEPTKESFFTRIGKAAFGAISGSDDDHGSEAPATDPSANADAVAPTDGDGSTKAGRTLSAANRDSLMAAHDAALDALYDAGEDYGMERYTDRDDVDFDVAEYDGRDWAGDHGDGDGGDETPDDADGGDEGEDEGEDGEEMAAPTDKDAPDGETSDADTTTMSDDEGEDEKSLAEKNAEQITELTEAVGDLAKAVADTDGDEPAEEKTAEVEIDGEVYEVTKAETERWFDDSGGDPWADAPAWAKELRDSQETNSNRIDSISRQSGKSTQVDAAAQGDGDNDESGSGLDNLGKALS